METAWSISAAADVVSTGDIFMTTGYPQIDLDNGGSIEGVFDALNRILDLTIPAHHEEGGTMVIPVTAGSVMKRT